MYILSYNFILAQTLMISQYNQMLLKFARLKLIIRILLKKVKQLYTPIMILKMISMIQL